MRSVLGVRSRAPFVTLGMAATAAALVMGSSSAGAGSQTVSGAGARVLANRASQTTTSHGAPDVEAANELNSYALERTAPALTVPGAALASAEAQAAQLPTVSGTWTQVTNNPDNGEPIGYNDPIWSNAGAGFRDVGGRETALAVDGSTIYTGAADGGVWKSTDGGTTWTPLNDHLATLSIGALAVNSADHSLWIGTGEANTNSNSYQGQGVFRSTGGSTMTLVGGNELSGATIYRLVFDGYGNVYAATSHGLWRRSASDLTSAWTLVLRPDPNPSNNPYETSFITDVVVQPGTGGSVVLAADGWRGAGNPPADTKYNGFYLSTSHGTAGTFGEITPTGAINANDIGRTSFAYAADGSKLYAIVESPADLLAGDASVLQGVFVSTNGSPFGPWTLIADATKLCNSGSGLSCPSTYEPGVQAWYNQSIIVDPANPNHLFVGLEEEYQSFNAGQTWNTISPYWNYIFPCDQTNSCAPVTHPDQHAVAIAGSTVYIGNDGGVYSRALDNTDGHGGWTDLNDTLHTLQYYDAEAGAYNTGVAEWGGLQDNGTTITRPDQAKTLTPAGGDGGYVIVNPSNARDAVGEYTYLNPYLTTDGGKTFTTITPSCLDAVGPPITNCDPNPRFIAPLATDVNNPNHWVAGGEDVWNDTAAWNTVCTQSTCSWKNVHDTGAGHSITALAVNGSTTYAGWCGNCNIGGSTPFASGIDTNYGGTWHRISAPNLPNRYIAGITVDAANPAHVYAVYNGYSRRWIPNAGTGHVFESTDGGSTWTDVSTLLPDIPSDGLVIAKGQLELATDIGVFIAPRATGPTPRGRGWARTCPTAR